MKKILISAFSCLPNRGSEPGVGWNWAVLAAEEGYDVTVLTRTKCKKKIEPAIPEEVKKIYILPTVILLKRCAKFLFI